MPRNPFRETEQERALDRDKQQKERRAEGPPDREDRPSWRERDKVKDRSPHSDQAREPRPSSSPRNKKMEEALKKQASSALDALFTKAPSAADTSEERLRRAATPGEKEALLVAHLASHGMPSEWDLRVALLAVKDEALVARLALSLAEEAPLRTAEEKVLAVTAIRERAFTLGTPAARGAARELIRRCG